VLKVKVKGHVIRSLSWILGMSYSVIDGLVLLLFFESVHVYVVFYEISSFDGYVCHVSCVHGQTDRAVIRAVLNENWMWR